MDYSSIDPSQMMGAGGAIGMGIGNMFAPWKNPASKASPYFNQMSSEIKNAYSPWVNYGQSLINDPSGKLNAIGAGYHESPGFQFALQQALQGAGHAAAAGGMAGSPEHEFQNMQVATGLANQDYNTFLQNALGLHQLGYTQGQSAGTGMGEDLASILANRAKLEYEGQNAKNLHEGGSWGSLFGGLGQLGSLAGMAAFL